MSHLRVNEAGPGLGWMTSWDRRGVVFSGGLWNGEPFGRWNYWGETALPSASGMMFGDGRVGAWSYWHPSGLLAGRGVWAMNVAIGGWDMWDERGIREVFEASRVGRLAIIYEPRAGRRDPAATQESLVCEAHGSEVSWYECQLQKRCERRFQADRLACDGKTDQALSDCMTPIWRTQYECLKAATR